MHDISPFLRIPVTDITGGMISHQLLGRCAVQEMEYMNCLEAYGLDRGAKKCRLLFQDYHECHTLRLQMKRVMAMRAVRQKKIREGKFCPGKEWENPRIDGY